MDLLEYERIRNTMAAYRNEVQLDIAKLEKNLR